MRMYSLRLRMIANSLGLPVCPLHVSALLIRTLGPLLFPSPRLRSVLQKRCSFLWNPKLANSCCCIGLLVVSSALSEFSA